VEPELAGLRADRVGERTIGNARAARRRIEATLDAVGAVILAALTATVVLASRGDRSAVIALLWASVSVLVAARFTGKVQRTGPAIAVLTVATFVTLDSWAARSWTGLLDGPLPYENASGAFLAQAAFGGALVAVSTRRIPVILAGALAGAAFGLAAMQASTAAAVTLGLLLLVVAARIKRRWARPAVLVASCLFLAVLASTVLLGATFRGDEEDGGLRARVYEALTDRRIALWHDALSILAERPGGVGPARFDDVPPRLVDDPDAEWAHNEFLQQGAELGWAGLVLTVLLFLWGFARLWVHPVPDAALVVGAASLAALGIHASVDYILHFPAVPLTAAAIVGAAQAAKHRRSVGGREGPGEEGVEGGAHPAGVAGPPPSG